MTSPYEAHSRSIDALQEELERVKEKVLQARQQTDTNVIAKAGDACGLGGRESQTVLAAAVFESIRAIGTRLTDALEAIDGAKQAVREYRGAWGQQA